ncbi:MAG: hypothetical protein ISS16_03425 [Ignavibacteria bacterium]|nr:hypothetical protein [Ignavibacteria bacterium]
MKIYQVMVFNAIVLIIIGAYGYVISGSLTALIAPAIGVLLILLAIPVKSGKGAAVIVGSVVTGVTTVIFFIIGFIRGNSLIIIMAVVSLAAVMFYVSNFTKQNSQE